MEGYDAWDAIKESFLQEHCAVNVTEGEEPPFDFGIYLRALSSGIVSSKNFVSKYFFCLWWGLQNLRYACTKTLYKSLSAFSNLLCCVIAVRLVKVLKLAHTLERSYSP